jgi:site-specific recombinase XerD
LNKFANFIEQNNLDFLKLTAKQAKKFRNQVIEQGLKPRTVNRIFTAIKGFYDFLVEEEVIKVNPIVSRRLRVKEGKSLPGFMTVDELQKLMDWLITIPEPVALGFRVMLATGLRVGEVSSFSPKDVIEIETGGYLLRVRHGKGNKERYVPVMDAGVAWDLAVLKGERRDDAPLLGVAYHNFGIWARKCQQETGMKFYSRRSRHTVGTQLLQKGIPLDQIQEILGHAKISTTRIYARTMPQAVWELAASIDEIKEDRAVYRYLLLGE